ncbi:toxin-antitoxin system TumE family protein [Halogeometricum luteum]|uniref:DUF6516 family protein n=1 Tax=Halogeometricum luteum TaxID=2950537 RepID=A0ABU2G6Z1_9EURY|nr:DUF6516 family protein [Halogeometricum sp. S3BR5-2]MDS0296560.1 DUF6516 family protein [Halogeometricum sp. S3BR5-2]
MAEGDDTATEVLDVRERFPTNATYAQVSAYHVPRSERYPDGVKYRMQYGRSDAPEDDDGTIIRYDNFPDHPDAPLHHKHTEDGGIEPVEFDGLLDLFHDFKQEVRNYGEHWD